MRSSPTPVLAATLLVGSLGCGGAPAPSTPKSYKTLPYDGAKIPKGSGWSCYVVTLETSATLSWCFRESSACEAAQQQAAGSGKHAAACAAEKEAFCVTFAEGTASSPSCSRSKDDCDRFRASESERTSTCTKEP